MRRRLLLSALLFAATLVAIVATTPYWLGTVAGWLGPSRGLTFGGYERLGYSRFALRDVVYQRPGVRVTLSRVEADTPVLWWWRRTQGKPENITGGDWLVEVQPVADAPRKPATNRGWMTLRAQLQRIATTLDRWLPRATLGPGRVRWANGEVTLESAKWEKRELAIDDVVYRSLKLDAAVAFLDNDRLNVDARMWEGVARLDVKSRGREVAGDFFLLDQPSKVNASFGESGWLPAEGVLEATGWNVPGSRLKLDTAYSAVRGGGRVEWRAGRFSADVALDGAPVSGKSVPPLHVALRGAGDTQAFMIQSLDATLPGIRALLTEPVTVERSGKIRESAARFTLEADLAKVPWFSAQGVVKGEAGLVSGFAAAPVVDFSLNAQGVEMRGIAATAMLAKGRLDWPRLDVQEGRLTGGEGETVTWRGGWDFKARELLNASAEGELHRKSLARWLPAQPEFERVSFNVHATGPLAKVAHRGTAKAAAVKAGALRPLSLAAEWKGQAGVIENFQVDGKTGASRVLAGGRVEGTTVTLTKLDFTQGDAPRLRLVAPAAVRWKPQLQVDTVRLVGPDGTLTANAALGQTGRIEIAAQNVSAKWFSDLIEIPGPAWSMSLFALNGTWDRGPMTFALTAGANVEIGEGRTATVNVSAQGDKSGVGIKALRATEANETVVNATGRLPVAFSPGGGRLMSIDADGALVLDASVAPNAAFWQKLAAISGVDLKDPQASARLTGTWRKPEGAASFRAARITIDPKRIARPLPAVESLDVQIVGDPQGVTLSRFVLSIEGQTVQAEGRLPVPDGRWDDLFRQPLAAARAGADLHLTVPDAEVAVFTRFLPAVLAPKGRLQADLRYKGGGLEGYLRLRDAASRPLGPLGVLQEISADITMSGRKFTLERVTAKSGGQPVTLNGDVEMLENAMPRFDLTLRGENLPFVRQTGLLMRGDLDLKLQTPEGALPRLSGSVRLRDSLFLSDVRSFLPKGGASATKRPPYFAIETQPVNTWQLAVEVVGEKFLRLRTPVFAGVASARFRLGGTLGEPRAIGEIVIEEGSVRMPFASFSVTQGSIRLTEADPYEPAVYLRGTGRRYGYDLAMEIEGTASQPNVIFTSSPPLDSEQVLLMVMTGSAPSNEISRSATQRVANIGLFLGQSLLGSLGSDAADADRLSFASGEKISRQGKETYDIEYKLSDRWTLTGEYNEFDEYNAGIKWRAFQGKSAGDKANAKK